MIFKIGNQWFIEPDATATGTITPIGGRGDEGPFVPLDLGAASVSKDPPSLSWQFLQLFATAFGDSSVARGVDGAKLGEEHSSLDNEDLNGKDIPIDVEEAIGAQSSEKSIKKPSFPKRAGMGWTADEDERLKIRFNNGKAVKALALQHG